ncbi:MoxR family ATPase [Mycobacterium sp. 21AC1]|uniref:AAA family ATPase n=1 Tax=[Mycobacterium] appelbergii TaxID=2939269 RepID=UPI0029390B6F|nr:MoxR family ATPase [Mycobacterium sp. 21AC1]MDV3126159.1 MoxR family ATPase [Mycobacterium sp. 21AC1]
MPSAPDDLDQDEVPGFGDIGQSLRDQNYFADEGLVTAIRLASVLERPLLLEGEPGVGKTEVARAMASILGTDLIRLQCYEGLDASQALYEWDYPKQLLSLRAAEVDHRTAGTLYTDEFLLERPLLKAIRTPRRSVLLIDEIDRADSEFEAFLLEFLDRFEVTIPEIGTVTARRSPLVVLTSNRTRELHDALKRRCLYHWIPFPEPDRERAIIDAQAPGLGARSAEQLVASVNVIRGLRPMKRPGIAESIAWARGSQILSRDGSDWLEAMQRSLGLLVKHEEDLALINDHAGEVFGFE